MQAGSTKRLLALTIVVAGLGIAAPAARAQVVFQDDFNRPNSNTVGNGWSETESQASEARIRFNRLDFRTNNLVNLPQVVHTFSNISSGTVRWTYEFNWNRTGNEQWYEVWMQLGNSALMTDPNVSDNAGVAVNLKWAGPNHGMVNHQGFGYVQGGSTTEVTVIGGNTPHMIEVLADLNSNTFTLIIDGTTQATGIAFDNNVSIDAVRLYGDEIARGNFSRRSFDNIVIESIETTQTAYAWSDDTPTFTSLGDDTPLTFQANTVYLLALQVSMTAGATVGDWYLQVREDGAGPWLNVLDLGPGASLVWQTYNTHVYSRANGSVVPVAEFGINGVPVGFNAVDGEFSDDNNGLTDGYGGPDTYTELQYAIRAEPGALNHTYEFRVVYQGTVLSAGYNVYAQAVPAAPQMAVTKTVNPSGTLLPNTNLTYTVAITNSGTADARNVTIVDSLAAEVQFSVGSVVNNLPPAITVVVEYSDDGGTTWAYVPVSGACGAPAGFDRCVTHIRWTLQSDLSFVAPDNAGGVEFGAQIR